MQVMLYPSGRMEKAKRELALKPLYSSVPESVSKHPDPLFYDLLTLLDAIRSGRVREKKIAIQKLSEMMQEIINLGNNYKI